MSPVVETGNEILIPLFDPESAGKPVIVNWQQDLSQRKADYYALTADNITTGTQFPFFIAAEYYENSTQANPNHITKVGELVPGEGYMLKVDQRLQYGQKNAAGELRFVVYHDKEHRPYQHRFIETAIGSATVGKAAEMAKLFGVGAAGAHIVDTLKGFIGDYLHTF